MNKFIKQYFYLLLALPLGVFYFVIVVTGLALGLGLFIITLGIPVFSFVFGFANVFSKFERALANSFLETDIPALESIDAPKGIWASFQARFLDGRTWIRIFYLLAKLPIGIAGFTIEVTLFFVSLFLILTPFLYQQFWYHYVGMQFWHITTVSQVWLATLGGIVLTIIFVIITKALAAISESFIRAALVQGA